VAQKSKLLTQYNSLLFIATLYIEMVKWTIRWCFSVWA